MKVTFRKERDGELLAVFAELATPHTLTAYAHVGQHTDVSLEYYRECTKPATPGEYAGLLAELRAIGYDDLRVVKRLPSIAKIWAGWYRANA